MIDVHHNDGRMINLDYINFSSNDYLGIAKSPRVKQAFIEGINLYGFGSGASPLVSGYYSSTKKLEEAFANFLNVEQTIFFNSGYHANLGLLQALAMPIIMDKLCHASIIDGARLTGLKFQRYRHNDLSHAEAIMQENSILISEQVFSMEGDIADNQALLALAHKYKSTLIIDNAHGFGILDGNIKSDLLVIPLGKALGGMGAIIAGSNDLINYLRQFARSYIYSTALPPAIAHANLTALQVLSEETWRLRKLRQLITLFNFLAKQAGLSLASNHLTPIRAILIDNAAQAKALEKKLCQQGFFVKAIVPPTVQKSRIRISLSSLHEEDDISNLIKALQ